MDNKAWTLSNILSASRIVLTGPIVYCYARTFPFHREWSLAFVLVALITDTLDGYFARRWNQVSEIGKIIDPLADKIGVAAVVVLLVLFGDIPFWYMSAVLARDILIFSGGIYIRKTKKLVLTSTMAGKITVVTIALTLIFAMLHNPFFGQMQSICMWISIVMMMISFLSYARRFFLLTRFSNTIQS